MNINSIVGGVDDILRTTARNQRIKTAVIDTAIVGGIVGGAVCKSKITGKPVGIPGDYLHLITNNNLTSKDKFEVRKEQIKDAYQNTLKIGATSAFIGGSTALAYAKSPKVATVLKEVKTGVGELLSTISVNNKNLKDVIKNTKLYSKINALPTPAKVALTAGSIVLSIITPFAIIGQSQRNAYIEGRKEAQ